MKMKNMEFEHLMLDIETMGTDSYSSILSIGAVEFDITTGRTGKEFYQNISLQSCMYIGLVVNASTIMWWMKQSEEARKSFDSDSVTITEALKKFSSFCDMGYQVWGNSASFDCGILKNAYDKCKITIPWDFRKERCVRTLVSFNPEIKNNYPSVGIVHNSLSDCYFQIGYCHRIWDSITNR